MGREAHLQAIFFGDEKIMTKGSYKFVQALISEKTYKGLAETMRVAIDAHAKDINSKYNCSEGSQNEI